MVALSTRSEEELLAGADDECMSFGKSIRDPLDGPIGIDTPHGEINDRSFNIGSMRNLLSRPWAGFVYGRCSCHDLYDRDDHLKNGAKHVYKVSSTTM